MENSRGFLGFLLLVSSSSFLSLLVECHVWGSSGAKGHTLFPQHEGSGKLCIIHRAEGASITPFPSLGLTLLSLFLISELSPYLCVIGGAGRVLTVLDLQFPGRKRKVVKCSYNVVLEIVSQWRGTFGQKLPIPCFLPSCLSLPFSKSLSS